MATRNHVAMAAWSMQQSDVSGRSEFDWSGQLVSLKSSTVLLVMVYLTNGLAESGENLENRWELANLIRDCELPFTCMGDWNYDFRRNAENGGGRLHWRGVQDSCGRRVHLHLWKQTPGLRAGRPQAGKRGPGGTLLERLVEISHCSGGHGVQSTAHSYNETCIPKNVPRGNSVGKDDLATRQGPPFETQREERQRYSSYLWLHGDQELNQACEEVGAFTTVGQWLPRNVS